MKTGRVMYSTLHKRNNMHVDLGTDGKTNVEISEPQEQASKYLIHVAVVKRKTMYSKKKERRKILDRFLTTFLQMSFNFLGAGVPSTMNYTFPEIYSLVTIRQNPDPQVQFPFKQYFSKFQRVHPHSGYEFLTNRKLVVDEVTYLESKKLYYKPERPRH